MQKEMESIKNSSEAEEQLKPQFELKIQEQPTPNDEKVVGE